MLRWIGAFVLGAVFRAGLLKTRQEFGKSVRGGFCYSRLELFRFRHGRDGRLRRTAPLGLFLLLVFHYATE